MVSSPCKLDMIEENDDEWFMQGNSLDPVLEMPETPTPSSGLNISKHNSSQFYVQFEGNSKEATVAPTELDFDSWRQ